MKCQIIATGQIVVGQIVYKDQHNAFVYFDKYENAWCEILLTDSIGQPTIVPIEGC